MNFHPATYTWLLLRRKKIYISAIIFIPDRCWSAGSQLRGHLADISSLVTLTLDPDSHLFHRGLTVPSGSAVCWIAPKINAPTVGGQNGLVCCVAASSRQTCAQMCSQVAWSKLFHFALFKVRLLHVLLSD